MRFPPPLLSAALILLVPCLAAHGDGAAGANQPGKWEKEIAAYERADAAVPPPKGALLFVGSSSIRLWSTLARDFPHHPVINRGFGGSQIADATHFAPRIIFPCAPRAIYLRAGGNDLWEGKSVEQVFHDYKQFVAAVHAALPDTDIIFISISPSIARWKQAEMTRELNTRVCEHAKGKPRLRYIETYDLVLGPDGKPRQELFVADQLHFNGEGYKLMAERIRPDLNESYKPNERATKSRRGE